LKLKLICLNCGKLFEIEVIESYYKRGRYNKCCCKECSSKYSSSFVDRNKKKIRICKICGIEIISKVGSSENVYCDICRNKRVCKQCGKEICERPDVCKKLKNKNNVFIKYFNFDRKKLKSSKVYDEFDKIVNNLKKDYFVDEMSIIDMSKKYKMNTQTLSEVFKRLGIHLRTNTESGHMAVKNGKINYDNNNPYSYKNGFHVTWNDKKVHYRSSYELDYYRKLDEQKIDYDVEKLRLIYYDTQKKKRRVAIPDIYIPIENKIVEIKSNWTYDEQNWKDRLKTYKKLGYNVELVIK